MGRLFAQRLRTLRLNNNMTQKELANKLMISPSAVGMYEQGKREPNSEILSMLCNIFDVTIDYLLGREKNTSVELTDVVDDLTDKLIKQRGLMYNGKPVDKRDLKKIVEAMRLAAEFALKYEEKRRGE